MGVLSSIAQLVEWKTVVLPSIVILRSLVQLLFEGGVDVSLTQHSKSTILKYTPVFLPGESVDRGAWQATVQGSQRVGHD